MKMNNKGFAISTIVYGLSIMGILIVSILMGTMSNTRSNNSKLAKSIEEELNRFSKTETNFDSSVSGAQEFVVPTGESGWYKIELWGAQGGNSKGGLGAYTSGVIQLNEGDVIYFYVGKTTSGGGQETDVRIEDGDYNSASSYNTRIMVAAGGGKDSGADGGTLYGYTSTMSSSGGYIDYNGAYDSSFELLAAGTDKNKSTNGTLVGYPVNYSVSTISMSGTVGIKGTNNGGDGYIPSNTSTTGGVSYISGYAGVKSVIKGTATNTTKYTYYKTVYNESEDKEVYSTEGRDYYFLDGMMYAGTNTGDGKAKIEKVASITDDATALARKNTKLDTVQKVRDCVDDYNNANVTIQVIKDGVALTGTKTSESTKCTIYTLSTPATYVDEIAVFHEKSGVDYKNHTIEVYNGSTWVTLKGKSSETDYSETETVNGIRISAYQYDSTQEFPKVGNYYIIPVLTENKVITAAESAENDLNSVSINNLLGYKRQKWSIEEIPAATRGSSYTKTEYKITELARFKALTIQLDENRLGNEVYTGEEFNSTARNEPQIWNINTIGNGTYSISTVVAVFDSGKQTGNLLPQTRSDFQEKYKTILIGKKNVTTQRFKLISVDYSSASSYNH